MNNPATVIRKVICRGLTTLVEVGIYLAPTSNSKSTGFAVRMIYLQN